MKRVLVAAIAVLSIATSAPAQPLHVTLSDRIIHIVESQHVPPSSQAPERKADAARIIEAHRDLFGSDEGRLKILAYVCAGLNARDGGNWGLLQKNDQGGKIPADIIVWRPTREHFDVLTDAGATWIEKGPVPSEAWVWIEAPRVEDAPPPNPDPPNPPAPPPSEEGIARIIDAIRAQTALLEQLVAEAKGLRQDGREQSAAEIDAILKLRQGVIDASKDLARQLVALLPLILGRQAPK